MFDFAYLLALKCCYFGPMILANVTPPDFFPLRLVYAKRKWEREGMKVASLPPFSELNGGTPLPCPILSAELVGAQLDRRRV